MPTKTTVTLDIEAQDVAHSWWIPQLGGKFDAVPGHTNYTWFKIDKPGVYTRPVRRAVRAQPRRHDRAGARGPAGRVQAVARRRKKQRDRREQRRRAAAPQADAAAAKAASRRRSSRRRRHRPRLPRRALTHGTQPQTRRPDPGDHRPRGRARAHGLGLVGHDDRSQADRDHVPRHDVRVLHAGRRRGAAHAPAARRAGQHVPDAADVQRAVHAARHDDDLPVRRADHGRLRATTSCR